MNERIRELAERATIIGNTKHYVDVPSWYLEKFAELIIKQCAELTLDYVSPDYYMGWLDYRDEIKKHFGVKE